MNVGSSSLDTNESNAIGTYFPIKLLQYAASVDGKREHIPASIIPSVMFSRCGSRVFKYSCDFPINHLHPSHSIGVCIWSNNLWATITSGLIDTGTAKVVVVKSKHSVKASPPLYFILRISVLSCWVGLGCELLIALILNLIKIYL